MSVTSPSESRIAPAIDAVVDACAYHAWRSTAELVGFMDEAYSDLLMRPHDPAGPANLRGGQLYPMPGGANVTGLSVGVSKESGVVPGSDPEALAGRLDGVDRVVLGYGRELAMTVFPLPYVTRDVVKAVNDWTIEKWLRRDDRFHGMVLVSTLLPDDAAAEIRRAGRNPRMVAVALGANGLGRPFGDPAYQPVIDAAAEMDLPLVVQVGSDAATGLTTTPLGGGSPSTVAEFRALGAHSLMTHAASLIIGGAFERHPNLKLLLVGGGAAWVPTLVWSMDYGYRGRQHTMPWLKKLPSEYFAERIYLSTCSLESAPTPEALERALGLIPELKDRIVYTSCEPGPDAATPAAVAARLPVSWHDGVFRANADTLFRWPGR